jgi:acetoin utilization deacetylase AcuC-like enzyme
MKIFYSDDYVAAPHDFDTTRKAAWVARSLRADPIDGVCLVTPAASTENDLLIVHASEYVHAVQHGEPLMLAESSGFPWGPRTWTAVTASTGGAVAAALEAYRTGTHAGSLSSGLHHARRTKGSGFCTFNGLALAATAAVDAGARSVLILDLDAHGGGGTDDILNRLESRMPEVTMADISVSDFDSYASERLHIVGHAADYLPTIERVLTALPRFDLVIYNAGMDPHEDSNIGGLTGVTTEMMAARERMVFDWAQVHGAPIAFVLAGGYRGARLSDERLVNLHRETVRAAAGIR